MRSCRVREKSNMNACHYTITNTPCNCNSRLNIKAGEIILLYRSKIVEIDTIVAISSIVYLKIGTCTVYRALQKLIANSLYTVVFYLSSFSALVSFFPLPEFMSAEISFEMAASRFIAILGNKYQ